jgi:hypothetical protein
MRGIAGAFDVDPATVCRQARRADVRIDAGVALIARIAGDPRFPLLANGDLRALPQWKKYRHLD